MARSAFMSDSANRALLGWSVFSLVHPTGLMLIHPDDPTWSVTLALVLPFIAFVLPEVGALKLFVGGLLLFLASYWVDPAPVERLVLLLSFIGCGVGLWLALRCRAAVHDLGSIASGIALPPDADAQMQDFEHHLDIELARARRHGRSLTLLSIAVSEAGTGSDKGLMRDIERRRREFEIVTALRRNLYSYAVVCAHGPVIRALVPEAGQADVPGLRSRLVELLHGRLGLDIEFGAAVFPEDAYTSTSLRDAADAARVSAVQLLGGTRASGGAAPATPRVAYIMSRFPKLTETFVLDEILEMQRQGVIVDIHPLRRGDSALMHDEARALVSQARYRPLLDVGIAMDNLVFLLMRPGAWFACLADLVRHTRPSTRYLTRALVAFPRAVSLARRIPASGATHVHAHFASHPAALAWVISRLSGLPYSFTAHGSDLHRNQTMLGVKVADARFTVTIAQFNREFMTPHVRPVDLLRVHVIHCGIDVERFEPARGGNGVFSFGCTGTLHEVKGQRVLLEACARLRREGMSFHCHLTGDGPDRQHLATLAAQLGVADCVSFHGACERARVRELLAGLDVAVAPSVPTADGRREGLPVALMEAAACALPLVASRLSGIPELVRDGETGLLVEPGDAAGFANALARLAREPETRRRLGDAARTVVANEYSLSGGVRRLRELMFSTQHP